LRLPVRRQQEQPPLAPAVLPPASPSTTNFSLPLSSHDSTAAAKQAWNKLAVSHPSLPTFKEQTRSHINCRDTNPYRSTLRSARAITTDNDSDQDLTVVLERPANNFSDTNFFQSGSRESLYRRRQSNLNKSSRKTPVRRSRSSSVSSSGSEGGLTPNSSEASHSDLTAHVTQAESRGQAQATTPMLQEAQDHRIAQRMQHEGETAQSLFSERIRSAAPQTTHRSTTPISRLKRAIARSGTRHDPIDLSSESDEPKETHGEPMELDEVSMTTFRPPHDQTAQSRQRDCVVCGESVYIFDLPALYQCTHRPETCAECYSGWIAAQLHENNWGEVKCPGDECKTTLSYHDIQAHASPEIFQRYDTYIARAAISQDRKFDRKSLQAASSLTVLAANFRWCRACDSGQIHLTGVEGNIFTCAACGHKVCIVHENTWHEGETCEEYEYRASGRKERDQRAQEAASVAAIGQLTKKCPGPLCIFNIEKNDGCDHMTCKF
jgi:hypothetical protein